MTFAIFTHVIHGKNDLGYFAYAPYVKEMNIWVENFDKIIIVAPQSKINFNPISSHYTHKNIIFLSIPSLNFTNFFFVCKSILLIPVILLKIFYAMAISNHLHLRCPGNIGLLACIVQLFFPYKVKTAKYAGNFDPQAKQPLSYKIQKYILKNELITKKIKVLVYGNWLKKNKNIVPFFTASYSDDEIIPLKSRSFTDGIKFLFVGSLSLNKNPLYAIKLVQKLKENHLNVCLDIYGDGILLNELTKYINLNNIQDIIKIHGNQNAIFVKQQMQSSHFIILPSVSEGWPKVIAEAMFWGCLPITTPVSCVPEMLDNGCRGLFLTMQIEKDVEILINQINSIEDYKNKIEQAANWSRIYTIEKFKNEIIKIIKE